MPYILYVHTHTAVPQAGVVAPKALRWHGTMDRRPCVVRPKRLRMAVHEAMDTALPLPRLATLGGLVGGVVRRVRL